MQSQVTWSLPAPGLPAPHGALARLASGFGLHTRDRAGWPRWPSTQQGYRAEEQAVWPLPAARPSRGLSLFVCERGWRGGLSAQKGCSSPSAYRSSLGTRRLGGGRGRAGRRWSQDAVRLLEGSGTCHGAASRAPRLVRAGEGVGPSARLLGALVTSPSAGLLRTALEASRPGPGSRGPCSPLARAAGPDPGLVAAAPARWSKPARTQGRKLEGRALSRGQGTASPGHAGLAGGGEGRGPEGGERGIRGHRPGGCGLRSVPSSPVSASL